MPLKNSQWRPRTTRDKTQQGPLLLFREFLNHLPKKRRGDIVRKSIEIAVSFEVLEIDRFLQYMAGININLTKELNATDFFTSDQLLEFLLVEHAQPCTLYKH